MSPFFQSIVTRQPVLAVLVILFTGMARAGVDRGPELRGRFASEVRPFLDSYCLKCHDAETAKGDLNLSSFESMESVVNDYARWELVLERLRDGDMPPAKAKKQPGSEVRKSVVEWIQGVRDREAERNAGDPGPVLARRLSNAEYDYTIRDLTGANIRPTRNFPVDPANQAGFDNSGESLTMSPALLKKYLQAAREVAEHLVLKPDGIAFAPHPVVADTDRDKWAVLRIVDFYSRQPTDYAGYFLAAWRYQHRSALGKPQMSLEQVAAESKVSAKYLKTIWATLTEKAGEVGPIARLQTLWRNLPAPGAASEEEVRQSCAAMREYVTRLRDKIVPEVKNLSSPPIQSGSQTLVLWKNRQMAANRRRYDPGALRTQQAPAEEPQAAPADEAKPVKDPATAGNPSATPRPARRTQDPTPDVVKKGGTSLPPALITTGSSATEKMAASKKHDADPDLILPTDPGMRAPFEAAFAKFSDVFPDAFFITERARVYMDAEKEKENSGRLLSAGLHSMTGYFRDDSPLYDLILDDAGRKELDRLWQEFDFVALVPQRMHTSFLWFERTDSVYLRDPEFDPYRPEDKSATTQEKIRSLGELYLAKARSREASETVQRAISEHFQIVAANILRVEQERAASEPGHLKALEDFAGRAFRRTLSTAEREDLREFYRISRRENGLDHEEAMRDCVTRVLMSPHFCFRIDLLEAAGNAKVSQAETDGESRRFASQPLSDVSLASRLSYFLWASMPDADLLAHAAAGDLHQPDVLRTQVKRMLKDDRVRNFATEFGGNWLDFRRFEQHNSVDRERFPSFDDSLRSAMFEEPIRFFVDVVQSDRSALDFLYARDTFVNAPLANHYGIPAAAKDRNTWAHVEHADQFGRGGLLPMAVFLTVNSPGLRTSPVKRGNWVVKRLLGERIPPPPATVPELPGDEKTMGERTLREVLAKHRDNEACAGCHARFDSFGLVFESYGPVGERRERDLGGRPVDVRAEFPNGTEGEGMKGLLRYVKENRQDDFLDNLCRKLLAYALGRTLIPSDIGLIKEMRAGLVTNEYRMSSLIECIATSPQFLTKRSYARTANN